MRRRDGLQLSNPIVLAIFGAVTLILFLLAWLLVAGTGDRAAADLRPDATSTGAGTSARGAPRVMNVHDFRRKGRSDADTIQAAIDAARPGDTVYFPGGTYRLGKPFVFTSGIDYVGDPQDRPVLVGTDATAVVLRQGSEQPLSDATIRGLRFDNVVMRFEGGHYGAFSNVTLQDCEFRNGKAHESWSSDYVWLAYTEGFTIDGCTFLRDANSGGRGIVLERTRLTVVKDSYIGTTRDLEDGTPNGYFKTAINLSGYSDNGDRNENVVIDGNVWRRAAGIPCPFESASTCEDHGVYAWGVKGLSIVGNDADGWTDSGTGGSVKIRNSDEVFISRNHFLGSGVLAHTYWHTEPRNLTRVRVDGNRIDMLGRPTSQAIGYWRSNDTGPLRGELCSRTDGGEREIFITGNQLVSGGVIDIHCAKGSEFCVAGNSGSSPRLGAPSIRLKGCQPSASWNMPLAGVYRGDFNADGKQDFAQAVPDGKGGARWRVHLSAGDGFVNEDWGGGVTPVPDAQRYGVQVADFTGDGRSDLVYRGVCATGKACWLLHPSTGQSFAKPKDLGGGGQFGPETFSLGFHVGDFNGDKRPDIAYRGKCGRDAHPCWAVLASGKGDRLTLQDWGDRARWDPGLTGELGLLTGDFNGDGRDDIGYLGICSSEPCLRMHIGRDRKFEPQDWGYAFSPDAGRTAHFGIRVEDVNHDGLADLAYRGVCGTGGYRQWVYHLGAANGPFVVTCQED